MDEETKKEINDQFYSLPKTIQDAITSSDWQNKVHVLAKKYSLHIDQEGILINETFLVMLGIELAQDFVQNIADNLGVSKIIATQLAAEINTSILKPILSDLQTINTAVETEENEVLAKPTEAKPVVEEVLDRDSILKEIENPVATAAIPITPTASPAQAAPTPTNLTTTPAETPVVPDHPPITDTTHQLAPISVPIDVHTTSENLPTKVQPKLAPFSPVASTPVKPSLIVNTMPKSAEMIDDRLKNIVKTKTTEISASYSKAAEAAANKVPDPIPQDAYKADPYREPIN